MHVSIRVKTSARLHLGFLDLNGGTGRRFGSLGLAIDRPVTSLEVEPAVAGSVEGPERASGRGPSRRFARPFRT